MMKVVACVLALSCCVASVFSQTWDSNAAASPLSGLGSTGGTGGDLYGMGGTGGQGGGMGGMFGNMNPMLKWWMFRKNMDMNFLPAMMLSGMLGNQQGGQGGGLMSNPLLSMLMFSDRGFF